MADTIPSAPQPTNLVAGGGAYGQVWWCRGPDTLSFTLNGQSYQAGAKNGLVTAAYATPQDVFNISVGEDQTFDYASNVTAIWLRVGAAKINEFLGQRFQVPLTVWSDTVIWANSELCYIGITRKRGINSEALMADFRAREEAVLSWLKSARDHEITPDQRLSIQDQPQQALRYFAQPTRGWDARATPSPYPSSPYAWNGAIGSYRR